MTSAAKAILEGIQPTRSLVVISPTETVEGQIVRTAFGVKASVEERERAMAMHLSCISAIPSCETTSDLMPEAHKNLSFEPNPDESFNQECQDYMRSVEVGTGPWSVESAFSADPISLKGWILDRAKN